MHLFGKFTVENTMNECKNSSMQLSDVSRMHPGKLSMEEYMWEAWVILSLIEPQGDIRVIDIVTPPRILYYDTFDANVSWKYLGYKTRTW